MEHATAREARDTDLTGPGGLSPTVLSLGADRHDAIRPRPHWKESVRHDLDRRPTAAKGEQAPRLLVGNTRNHPESVRNVHVTTVDNTATDPSGVHNQTRTHTGCKPQGVRQSRARRLGNRQPVKAWPRPAIGGDRPQALGDLLNGRP